MSEKAPHTNHEQSKEHELGSEHHEKHEAQHVKHEAHETKVHTKEDIEKLSREALNEANETKPVQAEDNETKQPHVSNHQALKKDAYKDLLQKTRQRLPKKLRTFSKVVHNNTIDNLSNVSAYTVARPSGLLGGGIGAFVGSSLLLYFSRKYGFSYNFGAFAAFFVGGFVLGLIGEAILKILKPKKS